MKNIVQFIQHFFLILFYLTLQYCICFDIYQNESATGIHVFQHLCETTFVITITSDYYNFEYIFIF